MNNIVNISLQVLPSSDNKNPYEIVDKAISVIDQSGLKYKVCPFETVIEGPYDQIMALIKEVYTQCFDFGAESIFANIKMQLHAKKNVYIDDKTGKYE